MREIDLATWPRREVYGLFDGCDWPFYQVSFPLDVTRLCTYTKKEGLSFYYTLSWLLTKAMERQEAFCIRMREGKLVVLDELMPSCTVLVLSSWRSPTPRASARAASRNHGAPRVRPEP